jgi:DNA-directed RNA polymerase subunit RPC12/RpoP
MRLHYYCGNCGSEIVLQDSVWLGDRREVCPICGDDTGALVALVPEKNKEVEDVAAQQS